MWEGSDRLEKLLRVRNVTRETSVAERALIADTSQKRRTGLLKHTGLDDGEGLWIVPCEGVHMFGMKFDDRCGVPEQTAQGSED